MTESIKITHTADGTPCTRLYLGRSPITGRAHRPYKEFPGMTDEEAAKAAEIWRESIAATYANESRRAGEMLARYVDRMEAQGHSYNTIKTYRLYTRRYAAPIAKTPIDQVTPMMLDDLFLMLLTKGPGGGKALSRTTVKKFREYLKGAFRSFVQLGLMESNPIPDTMPIPALREDARALDETDAQKLQAHITTILEDEPDTNTGILRRNAALGMFLALHTGARAGEVCALRRRDVNLITGVVSINGNVIERERQAVRQPHTKGKRSRNVALDVPTVEALKAHIAWQSRYLATADRNTPICTVDGQHMTPSTLSEQFRRLRAQLKLDPCVTFHSLRHTHATLLLQGGTELHTVSERLGHAQPSTTLNIYAHVLEGRDRAAANAFAQILEPP